MEVKRKLRRIISELEQIRGKHTELISIYVPANFNLDSLRNQVLQEKSTAQNIKSKTTRKNVIAALERIYQELKRYRKTPANGMAIFCGNVSQEEGSPEYKIWVISPPEPMMVKLYRCDKEFVLRPLKEILEAKYCYGLIVVDTGGSTIGLLKGKSIIVMKEMESWVPGKTRKGGQSAVRYARQREGLIRDWFKHVGEEARKIFSKVKNLKGLLVGGPGPSKDSFLEGDFLPDWLKQKVIGVKSLSYTSELGLQELVDRSQDILKEEEIMEEKRILNQFFSNLARETGISIYGGKVGEALSNGLVEKLLLSESLPEEKISELSRAARETGSEVIMISTQTREGKQLKEIGGVGAILRFGGG
jgi:peptide chain release factor subunit 1